MIVSDTNLLAHLWIPGEHTAAAEQVIRRDPAWAVPLLWRSEFRNVLAGGVRRGKLSLDLAVQVMEEAEGFLKGREYSVPSAKVLALSAASRCSAYDCEFVALAEEMDAVLVTADREILKAFPRRSVSPETFLRARSSIG